MPTVRFILQKPYSKRKPHGTSREETRRQLNTLETRLYACLIISRGQVIKIKTEHVVYPRHWNFAGNKMKDNIAGSIEFNSKLDVLKKKIMDEYDRVLKEDYPPEAEVPFTEMRARLIAFSRNTERRVVRKTTDFFEVLDEYIESLDGVVAEGTIKKYTTLKNSLKDFSQKNERYRTLMFSAIDHRFYDAYTKYLRNQEPRGRMKTRPEGRQRGLLIDTVAKYIECLRNFLFWAEKRKINNFITYKDFRNFARANSKHQKNKHDIVTLTLAELKQFYEYDFYDDPVMDRVRDLFCFEAFTGQCWSDTQGFDKSQLHGDVWTFTAYKTKKLTEIDLSGYAAPAHDILRKYDYKLPLISNQKFNENLKKAAEKAGINSPVMIRRYVGTCEIQISKPKCEFLSSHTARRTCVSILLNDYNINPTHVREITGHSDFKTLDKYIRADRLSRRQAMSRTVPVTKLLIDKIPSEVT